MKRWMAILFIFALVFFQSCKQNSVEPKTLLETLQELAGVEVTEITPLAGYSQAFQIDVTQYIDHDNPARGTFKQRFYLSHRDEGAPTVFYTSGYGISRNYESELAALLQANQVLMVHRYFPNARPSPLDWTYLTIRQAAADQHVIRELLKNIYTGKWVSGGGSKGGMTALFYRRYFPDDVAATVAYVAPVMDRYDDPRFAPFLNQVGTADCRQKIRDFQREILSRRTAMLSLLQSYAQTKSWTFSRVGLEAAFEYAVVEYPFAFWQYGRESNCSLIPGVTATDPEMFDHLEEFSGFSYYTDSDIEYYEPLFYQAYTEFGYCPYIYGHLQDLLQAVPQPSYRAFAPQAEMTFHPEVMQDVMPWLINQGEKIVYIYGGIDPWSAGALVPNSGLDSLFIMQPGANHSIRIKNLDQQALVVQTLNRWLGVQADIGNLENFKASPEEFRFRKF